VRVALQLVGAFGTAARRFEGGCGNRACHHCVLVTVLAIAFYVTGRRVRFCLR
jgi:hypothetical protein